MAALPNFFPYLCIDEQDFKRKIHDYGSIFLHDQPTGSQIGNGSYGTVYKGEFLDCEILIKKVLKKYSPTINTDISKLVMNNNHPNILRYVGIEVGDDHFYIGAELCEFNLTEFIRDRALSTELSTIKLTQIFLESMNGLNYLHNASISK